MGGIQRSMLNTGDKLNWITDCHLKPQCCRLMWSCPDMHQHKPACPKSTWHVHISKHSRESVRCLHRASGNQPLSYYSGICAPLSPTLNPDIKTDHSECTHKNKWKYYCSTNNNLLHTKSSFPINQPRFHEMFVALKMQSFMKYLLYLREQPLHAHTLLLSMCSPLLPSADINTRSLKEKHQWEVELVTRCSAAIFTLFMLIYAQIYAGNTGSGLCCVGPVSFSDAAHLNASSGIWSDGSDRKLEQFPK